MIFYPKIRIKEEIGEGLNAVVYKAEIKDSSFNINKVVAYKVLKRKEDLNHFKKELSNLMKASGKRLVKFYGWRKYQGRPGLILEFVDGVTLKELISNFDLKEEEKSLILAEVFKGLEELKDCGLYHGDLSPKNIMIDVFGEVKLIDFGMTKWRTKLIEATPGFVSPALLDGNQPSFKTDLDSLESLKNYMKVSKVEESFNSNDVKVSLRQKVYDLCDTEKTVEILASSQNPYQKRSYFSVNSEVSFARLKASFVMSLFCFFPHNLSFADKAMGFVVRSKTWLAVKKEESSSWCYSPCKLTYSSNGVKKILFKTSKTSGVRSFSLDQIGYKEIKESDFY